MRTLFMATGVGIMLVACGGDANRGVPEAAEPPITTTTTTTTTTLPPPEPEPPALWAGYETTSSGSDGLAAYAHGPLEVYETRDSPEPYLTLDHSTILGTVTVLGVVNGPDDGWVEVMLPVRPNGSTGWIQTDAVSLYVADGEIIVSLSDRELVYVVDGVELLRTEVGVGSDYNQTPTGHYFVTDSVTLADPNSPWGPHALGISARSDTITEFNGGDGIIGIHGTNNPNSIGDNVSLGCVRVPNDMITALHQLVPIGTRVTVNA